MALLQRTVGDGGDYANWNAALAGVRAVDPFVDDWELDQISNTADNVSTLNQAGFGGRTLTIKCSQNEQNPNDHTQWYTASFTCAGGVGMDLLGGIFGGDGGGNLRVHHLYFQQNAVNNRILLRVGGGNPVGGIDCQVWDCLIRGAGGLGSDGITHGYNRDTVIFKNLKIWDCDTGLDLEINAGGAGAFAIRCFVENCTIYACNRGVWLGESAAYQVSAILRNVVACGSIGDDWDDTLAGTYYHQLFNCADSDNSLAALNAGIAQTDSLANIVAADEFVSLVDTNASFLNLGEMGNVSLDFVGAPRVGEAPLVTDFKDIVTVNYTNLLELASGGREPTYATDDITGYERGQYQNRYSIGAYEARWDERFALQRV